MLKIEIKEDGIYHFKLSRIVFTQPGSTAEVHNDPLNRSFPEGFGNANLQT